MQGLLTDGEPTLKRPKIKIRAPKDTQVWLALQQWLHLIFRPYLSLVELVQMKRVCKSFATYAGLKELIALKIHSAFSGLPDRHWNRLAPMTKKPVLVLRQGMDLIEIEFFSKHLGKFLLIVDYHERKSGRFHLAAFSNYTRLEKFLVEKFFTNDDVRMSDFSNDGGEIDPSENLHLLQFDRVKNLITGEKSILYVFGWLPDEFFDYF